MDMRRPTDKDFEDWCRKNPGEGPALPRMLWRYLSEVYESPISKLASCCSEIASGTGVGCSTSAESREDCWTQWNANPEICAKIYKVIEDYVANGKRFLEEPRKDRFEMVLEGL